MGTAASKEATQHPAGSPERTYTEDEFLATFQRSYDYFSQVDAETSDRQPYFCFKDWYLGSKSGGDINKAIGLPDAKNLKLTDDTVLKGWIYPAPGSSNLEPVFVQVENKLTWIVTDRTREYRGYWVLRQEVDDNDDELPMYWLHQPSVEHYDPESLTMYRGVLAIMSNLMDMVFDRDDGASFVKMKATQVAKLLPTAFDDDLLYHFRTLVAQYLLGAIPKLTKSCAFIKSLLAVKSSSTKRLSQQQLFDRIEQAEQRSNQQPWGEPLGELLESNVDLVMLDSNSNDIEAEANGEGDEPVQDSAAVATTSSSKRQSSSMASIQTSSSKRQRAARQAVTSYCELDISDDDDGDDASMQSDGGKSTQGGRGSADSKKAAASSKTAKKASSKQSSISGSTKQGKKKSASESSLEAYDDDFVLSDIDEGDDELQSMDDASSDSGQAVKRAAKQKVKPDLSTTSKSTDPTPESIKALGIVAKNIPIFKDLSLDEIAATKDYLDPCGMEATDDIIDCLVGGQIDKISGLLERSLACQGSVGSVSCPLTLGTACSGTDAPALALVLLKEQLEHRNKGDSFVFKHEFSCENEPFKQAYLARNFDSILYPDITKMTDENPQDVYGQIQQIPTVNLFVAGTSCKNFSMLRSRGRLDLEDKGCSGETFMAAVEILFKEKPAMAIFENVMNAPWIKMCDYLTGRVRLRDIDQRKNIKYDQDKSAKLTFIRSRGSIVVDKVPAIYGVRCGATVRGFCRNEKSEIENARWPAGAGEKCTLDELMDANKISKEDGTIVFDTACTFCTQLVKVDTKNYGLPQTRERTYMFVWRPKDDDINDDLGQYWVQIVKRLEEPARHSIAAFMLEDDHPDVRRYREALNGPAGRRVQRHRFHEGDYFAGGSGDLKYNIGTRAAYGIARRARFLTSWQARGQRQLPPRLWLPWMNCHGGWGMDLLDILYASAIRDAESHDPLFSSFSWNCTQNAGRESHRTATPGIAGCLTPGGDFFVPHRGRPLLGCERLLAQGIPYFRLMLGNESNVQLGDLAGNAMSLTVVCATMLAALTCNQLRKECIAGKNTSDTILKESRKEWSAMSPTFMIAKRSSLSCALPFLRQLAEGADQAVQSSVWCTCESSGNVSKSFVQCKVCRASCCRRCIQLGYSLSTHDVADVDISDRDHHPGTFHEKLRQLAPASLCFTKESLEEVALIQADKHRVAMLSDLVFYLHRIKRETRRWIVLYYARENYGVGKAVAELRVTVGELQRQSSFSSMCSERGAMAELTSFMPAMTPPAVFGKIDACARLILLKDALPTPLRWIVKDVDHVAQVVIGGEGVTASLRAEVGLADHVPKQLKNAAANGVNNKHFANAKLRGEERRWIYADNWKEWPETIIVKVIGNDPDCHSVAGSYRREKCRQTTNHSALWARVSVPGESSLYITIRPNVNRTGPDVAVITSSIDHSDSSSVVATFPRAWQPCDALRGEKRLELTFAKWKPSASVGISLVNSQVNVESPAEPRDLLSRVTGLSAEQISMLTHGEQPPAGHVIELHVQGGQKAQQIIRAFNATCAPPILNLAASSGLKYSIKPDAPFLVIEQDEAFGFCDSVVPYRPEEQWVHNKERKCMERTSQPRAARDYVLKLQEAQDPFTFVLDASSGALDVNCYPNVGAHHAAAHLLRERRVDGEVRVAFKLSDASQQLEALSNPFLVHNCNSEVPTAVPLQGTLSLYPRQQKVVTKMLSIENKSTIYEEVELSEFEMPGATGISLMARASRTAQIRGGVIADAIGAGKTVVSIALMLQGITKARESRSPPRKSSASLVVVPPGLIDQWESELKKFAPSLMVVKVYDWGSLQDITAHQILHADVAICPIDILESKGYLKSLMTMGGFEESMRAPTLPQFAGHAEQTTVYGVWITGGSQDPYAGANNPRNQRRRDDSAFYTYIYSKAIDGIRHKKLDPTTKCVPLEYFEWERVIVDEIHESLCTTKIEVQVSAFDIKERNRRAGRELLGITIRDITKRPLVFRGAMLGLTGTPLLDSSSRVTELANLMGGTYVTGLSSHWRKLEKESGRDIFLSSYLEPKQSREVRKMIDERCQEYLNVACCRNKAEEAINGTQLVQQRWRTKMSEAETTLYLASQTGIESSKRSLTISTKDFDAGRGAVVGNLLYQNAALKSRGKALVTICEMILAKDPQTKIIVFADSAIGAVDAAAGCLNASLEKGCTHLEADDTVQDLNRKISYYQFADATEQDKNRPRVLVLSFANAAGLNLQSESYNVILFHPLYSGNGGSNDDPVQDVSVELQAIGRVFRNGQTKLLVYVHRIEVVGPNDENCLDSQLLERNMDKETLSMATNAGD